MDSLIEARRAKFEAWHRENFKTKYSNGQPTRDMHNGKYAERYTVDREQDRWLAYNAALDSLVIELPKEWIGGDELAHGANVMLEACAKNIHAAGVRTK
jgi:hypothetical protein